MAAEDVSFDALRDAYHEAADETLAKDARDKALIRADRILFELQENVTAGLDRMEKIIRQGMTR